MSWFVVQLGARENYSVARALHKTQALAGLVTDAWCSESSLLTRLPQNVSSKLSGRYHDDLATANTVAFNNRLVAFELQQKLVGRSGWDLILGRNRWFQKQVVKNLRNVLRPEHTLFSYSYTAKEVFELGKEVGCRLVLGQIDPGVGEENIVADEVAALAGVDTGFVRAPQVYWDDWRTECELADHIVVNSDWSKKLLVDDGVDCAKVAVVPLVECAGNGARAGFVRVFPESFTRNRPLNVLCLGQVIPRKGIHHVMGAAEDLVDAPVKFTVVGHPGAWQEAMDRLPNVEVVGGVHRNGVAEYYQAADVFLFPTLSDGFGLTQLEAQRWRLPLVCSSHCGQVVKDGVNGIELNDICSHSIGAAIGRILETPSLLRQWSNHAVDVDRFGLNDLACSLQRVVAGGCDV